jgi:hypothetical protein
MVQSTAVSFAMLMIGTPFAAAQNASTTVSVNATASVHSIDPRIYGVAYASTANLTDLNFVVNRYGGDNASRYNWMLNADNRGNDWYFESIGDASSTAGFRIDNFVDTTRSAGVGAEPMITIPMIDYIANLGTNRAYLSSFSIKKYGAQTGNDSEWFPDAGNGISAKTNSFITGNNPLDADIANSSTFQQGLIQHLVSTFGTASGTGVKYYIYDNEHSIWYLTHRDVHPTGATMQEIKSKIITYGNMIKTVDPSALLVGPEEWGWSGYFYSGYDQQYCSQHGWSTQPDRAANGNMDYLPWLLNQLYQNQVATGKRLLDIFTVHYYPQGGEFSNDVTTATQLLRNRSTRSLWDPTYIDTSWINANVQLIPRLKGWVNQYYPGTKVGITEYNWGAESSINGATAQADILGIFGSQGLDLATRWTVPDPSTPTYKAMKLYRNYDGNKSTFGDTSVSTTVPNPDNVSAFSAIRSSDGALTIVVISKYLSGTTPVTLNLANFAASGTAQVYQLTSANTISHLSNITFTGTSISTTLPAQSVTLLVIPATGTTPPPPPTTPPSTPTFTALAAVSPASFKHNTTTQITVKVTDTGGPLTNGIVDMEVYNAAGTKVYQQYSSAQNFASKQTLSYSWNWTPTVAGTYTVKVGVFNSTWLTSYYWNNGASTATVK